MAAKAESATIELPAGDEARIITIMRILIASNYQWPHLGGIELAAQHLKHCWKDDGHSVTWVTTDIPRGAVASTPDNVRFPASNWFEENLQINTPIVNPLAYFKILNLVRRQDVISVHSLAPGVTALTIRAALACRKPLVVTQHVGIIPLKSRILTLLQDRVILRSARSCTRRGTWMTFVSPAVRDWFIAKAKIDPDHVCLTPTAYNNAIFSLTDGPARLAEQRQLGLPDNRLKVLFVGRFVEKKGLPLIEQVARSCPDIHFTLIGEGAIHPKEWNLSNVRVVSPQPADTLRHYYASHDLLLLPAVGEGWPAVICEAMACGTPCLISRETFRNFGRDEHMFLVSDNSTVALEGILQRVKKGKIPLVGQHQAVATYAQTTWAGSWQKTARVFTDLFRVLTRESQG